MTDPPTPAPLRVAVAQAVAVAGDVATNARTAAQLVRCAADRDARVVVLPELFLPGYDMAALAADPSGCDITDLADVRLDPLREVSSGVVVVVGASAELAGRRTIALLTVADGVVAHAYDKQHLWGSEAELFSSGGRGATLMVDGWPLALAVCYDGCFPEHARAAADDGALGYLVPAAYVVGSEHRRDVYYAARALDNGMYVAVAGLTGRCGGSDFSGGSAVYDPEGRALVHLASGDSDVGVSELDAAHLASVRAAHRMGRDRLASLGRRSLLTPASSA